MRVGALKYLAILPKVVRYDVLHPHKATVLRKLVKALDDPKRTVRKEAVEARCCVIDLFLMSIRLLSLCIAPTQDKLVYIFRLDDGARPNWAGCRVPHMVLLHDYKSALPVVARWRDLTQSVFLGGQLE